MRKRHWKAVWEEGECWQQKQMGKRPPPPSSSESHCQGKSSSHQTLKHTYMSTFLTCILFRSTGRKVEKFQVAVNVAAAAKVTFELIYEELLKRKLGKYELLIKVKPKQLVQHFQVRAISAIFSWNQTAAAGWL